MRKLTRVAAIGLIGATTTLGMVAPAEALTVVKVYAATVNHAYMTCVNIVGGYGLVATNGPVYDQFGRTYWWCKKR